MSAPGDKRRNKDGGRNDWMTPPGLFDLLLREFPFRIDAAADGMNTLCWKFYGELSNNAFEQEPVGETIWCNPPYGNLKEWIPLFIKWQAHGNTVVALVPAAPDTEWWKNAYENASEIRLLSGRVKFINPETGKPDGSNTTGSTIFVFDPYTKRPKTCYLWDWKANL